MPPLSFLFFASVALVGGANMVAQRNPVHCAMWLVCSFLGMAGLFLELGSGFLAAIQVLVYAGAIMVLFLFAILLLNLDTPPPTFLSGARLASGLAALTTLVLVAVPFTRADLRPVPGPPRTAPASPEAIAQYLFTEYVLPFEIISLLLLVAMVGAIHLARRPRLREGA